MSKKTTMQDIAKELQISVNAVSIALNDKIGVSHQLRIKILETAKKMHYNVKGLNVKSTLKNKTLVVLLENKRMKDSYYYLDIVNQMKKEAAIFGYRVLIEPYHLDYFVVPDLIRHHHVAGVIVLGKINDKIIYSLSLYIQEILCVNHSLDFLNIDAIVINNYLGGYLSCEYLIKQGYSNIGFVGEIDSSPNLKQRFKGYQQCMINYFGQNQNCVCLTKDIEKAILHDNYQHIQKLLSTCPEMPEAFVCVNDSNASIIIKALSYNGYKIPQDIKIIGFDDIELCTKLTPTLSSLTVSREVIAKKAIRRMHEMIHEDTIPETIMLSPQIIERNSTKSS